MSRGCAACVVLYLVLPLQGGAKVCYGDCEYKLEVVKPIGAVSPLSGKCAFVCAALSPDETTLVTVDEQGDLALWNLVNPGLIRRIPGVTVSRDIRLGFLPNNEPLVWQWSHVAKESRPFHISQDGILAEWQPGTYVPAITATTCLSADKKVVYEGGSELAAVDVASGEKVRVYRPVGEPFPDVRFVRLSSDRTQLYSVHHRHKKDIVVKWDAATGQEVRRYETIPYGITALGVAPKGGVVTGHADGSIYEWPLGPDDQGKLIRKSGRSGDAIVGLSYNADGSALTAVTTWGTVLRIVDATSVVEGVVSTVFVVNAIPSPKRDVLILVEGRTPYSPFLGREGGMEGVGYGSAARYCIVLETLSDAVVGASEHDRLHVLRTALCSRCENLVLTRSSRHLVLWGGEKCSLMQDWTAPWQRIAAAGALTPDGTRVYLEGRKGYVTAWSVKDSKAEFEVEIQEPVQALYVANMGQVVACVCRNLVKFIDPVRGDILWTLAGTGRYLCSFSLSPDGGYAVLSDDSGTVSVWDLDQKKEVVRRQLYPSSSFVDITLNSPIWDRDSKYILVARQDEIIRWLWEKGELETMKVGPGFTGVLASLSNSRAVVGINNQVVCVDLKTKKELARAEKHEGNVIALTAVPGKDEFLSAEAEGAILLWKLSAKE